MNNTSYGTLYCVATPIGNLADISQRAIDTLSTVDVIAAEDTRHSKHLLNHFGIQTHLISLHEHNEQQRIEQLISRLQQGQSIALISDAGTPLISDPGYHLIAALREKQFRIVPIPGPCAAIAALSAAGLPAGQFVFLGFLSAKHQQRLQQLQDCVDETRTLVCYEAPHRIIDLLKDLDEVFGHDRYVVIARELTKQFETIYGEKLGELLTWIQEDPNRQRGEFVVVIQGQSEKKKTSLSSEAIRILTLLAEELPLKQAVSLAAKITHEKKSFV